MVAPTPRSEKVISWGGTELSPKYLDYINSQAWTIRKAKYFQRKPKICAACKATKWINLHHVRYDHLGNEPDSDFTPLCQTCHKTVHHIHQQTTDSLAVVTNRWVDRYGKKPDRPTRIAPRKPTEFPVSRRYAKTPKKRGKSSQYAKMENQLAERLMAFDRVVKSGRAVQMSDFLVAKEEARRLSLRGVKMQSRGNRGPAV